jgi:hypothetical protein
MAGACSAACAALFDTAVSVILAMAMLVSASAHGSFPASIYRSRSASPVNLHPQPSARWAKSVSGREGGGSTTACSSCVPSLHVSHRLLHLSCDFDLDGTCPVAEQRVSCVSYVSRRSFASTAALLSLTRLLGPSGLHSISTILTTRRHTSS